MKHKAQLEYDYNHDVDRIIEEINFGVFEEKPRIYKYAGSIKDLIDCQFTLEELITISLAIAYTSAYNPTLISVKNERNIMDKIMKQEEMWVSEDETN